MRRFLLLFMLMALTLGALASAPAMARRGHASVGVFIGPGWYPPYYRYPPYYYSPYYYSPYYNSPYYYPPYYAPVVVAPPTYIEQGVVQAPAPTAVPAPGYWYYCSTSAAYYPYVRECPGGWQQVAPQPAN